MAEVSSGVRVIPSSADCLAFRRLHNRHARWHWLVFVVTGIAIYLMANFLAGKLDGIGFAPKDDAILPIFGTLFVVFFVVWRRLVGEKRKGDLSLIPYAIDIAESGLRYSRDGVRSDIEWRAIYDIQEGPAHIFIMLSSSAAYPIPRRSFSSDGEYQDFFQRLKRFQTEHARGVA